MGNNLSIITYHACSLHVLHLCIMLDIPCQELRFLYSMYVSSVALLYIHASINQKPRARNRVTDPYVKGLNCISLGMSIGTLIALIAL